MNLPSVFIWWFDLAGIARQWPQLADYSVVTGQNINGAYIKALGSSLRSSDVFDFQIHIKLYI
jgi:hypothetical protein